MKPDKEPIKNNVPEEEEAHIVEPLPGGTEAQGSDARDDPEKRKENRERLGVDEEHKTPDMKEGHRGTFP